MTSVMPKVTQNECGLQPLRDVSQRLFPQPPGRRGLAPFRSASRRAPAPDALFDLLPIQIVLQRLLGELHYFVIARKPQSNQLALVEPVNLRMPRLGRQRLQPQPFLKPNDPVLNLQRVGAQSAGWARLQR